MVHNAFYQLFLKELHDLYNGENQIIEAFPNLIEGTTTPHLKKAFQEHLDETIQQKHRLEKIYSILNETPSSGEECKVMKNLIGAIDQLLHGEFHTMVRDAALIAAAQCIEHLEIARYGATKRYAKLLEYKEVADLLQESLDEEGDANKTLSGIAEGGFFTSGVNQMAMKE